MLEVPLSRYKGHLLSLMDLEGGNLAACALRPIRRFSLDLSIFFPDAAYYYLQTTRGIMRVDAYQLVGGLELPRSLSSMKFQIE